jgi:hypothetical protein
MSNLPISIDPDSEQLLAEKLYQSPKDFDNLQFIRRSMRTILREENKSPEKSQDPNLSTGFDREY